MTDDPRVEYQTVPEYCVAYYVHSCIPGSSISIVMHSPVYSVSSLVVNMKYLVRYLIIIYYIT